MDKRISDIVRNNALNLSYEQVHKTISILKEIIYAGLKANFPVNKIISCVKENLEKKHIILSEQQSATLCNLIQEDLTKKVG